METLALYAVKGGDGGGGSGSGDVTGVKGSAESTYRKGNVSISAANIGLGNVNNTADADKPISTATQTALDDKVDKVTGKGLSTNDYDATAKDKLDGLANIKSVGTGLSLNATTGELTGTAEVTVDDEISSTSENPVQNKVIKSALDDKADKVASATNGNFAGLNASGNLTDSGKKASDFQAKEFVGTTTEWNALTTAQKANYEIVNFTDDSIELSDIEEALNSKVDKVTGKDLSTNDYTNADKALVDSIPNLAPISLVKDTVGWTGKNLLKNTATAQTISGVTFTVNADGSITVNGTATSDIIETIGIFNYVPESLTLTGCPSGGAWNTYRLDIRNENNIQYENYLDTGNGVTFTPDENYIYVCLRIGNGATVSNLTFYPMLRRADILDDTYEPYHESVETMYEEEIHGVNLFDDSKIEVGKAWNGDTNANRARNIIPCEPNSEYIISMNGTNGLDSVFFSVSASIPPASQTIITSFPYTIRTGTSDRYITLGFNKTNIALSDVTALKIMLRKADIEDSTYRPYNNQAIQNQLNAQGVLGAKNLLPNNATSQTISGVTFTVNSDGSIIGVGTSNSSDMAYFVVGSGWGNSGKLLSETEIKAGETYILSKGFVKSGIALFIRFYQGSTDLGGISTKDEDNKKFTVPTNTDRIVVVIRIDSGVTISNSNVFYPMLRLASDPDDTYVPYAMTNKELTDKTKDVAVTEVKSSLDSTYVSSCSSFRYLVKNGICFVYINNIKFTSTSIGVTDCIILPNGILPKASIPATSMLWAAEDAPLLVGIMRDSDNNVKISINGVTSSNVNHTWYGGNLIYPTA